MKKINTRKALNPAYRKHKPYRPDVKRFIEQLKECLVSVKWIDDNNEYEEHLKEPIKNFLQKTFYSENYINTKNNIDLAIYLGKNANSKVSVLIEAKKPSNKGEFLKPDNLNRKALQELLLYYLQERLDNENNDIKHLIATNGYEWYLFKAEDFYNIFFKNESLKKEYIAFRDHLKDSSKNELFYNEIAKKYIDKVQDQLPFVHLDFSKTNFDTLSDAHLNTLYKIFSDVHLLGHSFGNDSNQLNKVFYNELLHIIGLEELKDKGKKIIYRKSDKTRDYASLLESTIFALEDKDYLRNVKGFDAYNDKTFNVGLGLCLTWINRVLFLKLLESQLLTYHKGAKEYKFLQSDFINGFDDLNNLFFSALAKKTDERHPRYKDKFQYIPYLNSSLFERSDIETDTFEISALNDDEMEVFSTTILKDAKGKRFKGKLSTLDYLFKFLDAYDFATDGTEGIADEHENKTLINASVLGLIFEKINGYKEGSFYTPAYITMYMCKETLHRAVVQKFKENENDQIETFDDLKAYCHRFFKVDDTTRFNNIINSLRICDPAVGSGHFLVSALNELIGIKNELGILVDARGVPIRCDLQIENDELYITDKKNGFLFEYNPNDKESARIQHTLFHEKQTIIENCLFGVDINPNSVKICRLRLWIELLKNAYYTKNKELQTLPNIDINIKCGNSLISRFNLDDDLKSSFRNKKNPDLKYTFTDYKNAVSEYKDTSSKDRKREVLEIIDEVKSNFKSTLTNTILNNFNKAQAKVVSEQERQNNLILFGEKITAADKRVIKGLKEKAEKQYLIKEEIVNNAIYHNAFEWRFEFPEVLDDDGNYLGFDIVIGNPPYVEHKQLKGISSYLKSKYKVYYGSADLSSYFFELGINNLRVNGEFAYINTNKFFKTEYGKPLRKLLLENRINELINFEQVPIFDEALVSSVVIELSKKTSLNEIIIAEFCKEKFKNEEFIGLYDSRKRTFKLDGLSSESWSFNENSVLVNKIISSNIQVKDIDTIIIKRGITTGYDPAFIIDENQKEKLKKTDIIKPLLKGKDIKRYNLNFDNLYLINSHNGYDNIERVNLEENYKDIFSFISNVNLNSDKSVENRSDKGAHWSNLRSCAFIPLFNDNKIVWSLTSDKWGFAYDDGGYSGVS